MGHPLLSFSKLEEAFFIDRPNRFTAVVLLDGKEVRVHVRDSGRLGELLVPGARVLVRPKEGGKLPYELVAVQRPPYGWVFTNSGYHSLIVERLIEEGAVPEFRDVVGYGKEVKLGDSRIDFLLVYRDHTRPLEVKGCTLFEGDVGLFPDAPTERGRRHLRDLIGHSPSSLLFLTMNEKVRTVSANAETDPSFAGLLLEALEKNVHVFSLNFSFNGKELSLAGRSVVVSPLTEETLFLRNVLEEAARAYNEAFSPEANATPTALWLHEKLRFNVLFHGYLCVSCGLYDYFDDFSLLLDDFGVPSRPIRYIPFGNSFVVRFEVKE